MRLWVSCASVSSTFKMTVLMSLALESCYEDWIDGGCSGLWLIQSKWQWSKYVLLWLWKPLQGKGWIPQSLPRFTTLASLMHPALGLVGLNIIPGTNDIIFQETHPFIPPLALSGLGPKTIGPVRPARPPHYSHNSPPLPIFSVSQWRLPFSCLASESQCSVCSPSLIRSYPGCPL